ncbi:MAG: ion channel [Gaiellaceae bacterium]
MAHVRPVREGTEGRCPRRGLRQILGAGFLLVAVGTITYTTSQDWSLVDGFYFAVATLTTSSIADPELTITGAPIKIFTVFYILVGIGILVELARQLGFAYVQVRREEKEAKAAKAEHTAET